MRSGREKVFADSPHLSVPRAEPGAADPCARERQGLGLPVNPHRDRADGFAEAREMQILIQGQDAN